MLIFMRASSLGFRIMAFCLILGGFIVPFNIVKKLDMTIHVLPPGVDIVALEFLLSNDPFESVSNPVLCRVGEYFCQGLRRAGFKCFVRRRDRRPEVAPRRF